MIRKFVAAELIVRDLAASTAFYRDTLGLQLDDSGPEFAMFKVGDLYFFLQEATSVAQMMSEEPLDLNLGGGARSLFAVSVDDVDTMYADLKAKGIQVLRPPTDQPWGLRTAYFTDPDGNYWEIHRAVAAKSEA
jgi:catechol 2,3-dioxygenase-like lactoylglutathione lyase family enzyme